MRRVKRAKLQRRGWKVGDAAEFLDLDAADQAYIDLHLRLAKGLKERRISQKLTQATLAEALESSQSRVAKMESGDPTVSMDLMIRSLITLGASNRDLARIIAP